MSAKPTTDPVQIIAAAIDPEAYRDSAWTAPGLDDRATKLLSDMRAERLSKAERRATLAFVNIRKAGWNLVQHEPPHV